jgi:hypothetical protein
MRNAVPVKSNTMGYVEGDFFSVMRVSSRMMMPIMGQAMKGWVLLNSPKQQARQMRGVV